MLRPRMGIVVLVVAFLVVPAAHVEAQPARTRPFEQGHKSIIVVVGSYSSRSESYGALGGGFGYYVLPGLQLRALGIVWFRDDPSVTMAEVAARYVPAWLDFPVRPYAGVLARQWFVESPWSDRETGGVRGGMLWISGPAVIELGALYEFDLDCRRCWGRVQPEIGVGVRF